jgi:hypothetical protein
MARQIVTFGERAWSAGLGGIVTLAQTLPGPHVGQATLKYKI